MNYGANWCNCEITHGFDDKGRKFDSNGNLNDWWSEKDNTEYNKRGEKIVKQFNNCKILEYFMLMVV